jgi:hypothetical protein
MIVAAGILQHEEDERSGVLNIPTSCEVVSEAVAERIPEVELSRSHE